MRHPFDTSEIESIWLAGAKKLGFAVVRTHDAYASSTGRGEIAIGVRATLDEDDCYAQLVFHELCHAIVQGEHNHCNPDWGMDNTHDDDRDQEYACLRVQAHLAQEFHLRDLMAPTTVVRDHYVALPPDALSGDDAAATIARAAIATSLYQRWLPTLRASLAQTQAAYKKHEQPNQD